MFGGEDSTKKVKVLSGGERTRLAYLKLLLEPVNLPILDMSRPNHLDLETKCAETKPCSISTERLSWLVTTAISSMVLSVRFMSSVMVASTNISAAFTNSWNRRRWKIFGTGEETITLFYCFLLSKIFQA